MTRGFDFSRSRAWRFRATIYKQGLNPYVNVPETVTRAFAEFARAGRINCEGILNTVPIRATLIPAGRGKHRLYVNGGMRAAAGVGVGDRVTFELRATSPEVVRPPADLAAALQRFKGATAAFNALSPSHRRELLRYIDDARTPETRQRRIEKTIDHVLGKSKPAEPRPRERPLWTCPRCGNEFVNPNQYHSCARHNLSDPFARKPAFVRALFDRFRAMAEACGPVKLLPYRNKIGFMVRVRFAGAVPKTRWLEIGFRLARRVDHPRFHKIETIYPNAHIHLLRITAPEQLDSQVEGWLKEAYAIGCQEHLGRRANP